MSKAAKSEPTAQPTQAGTSDPSPHVRFRGWLFRLMAIVIGFSPFIGLEALARVWGWGDPQRVEDPFIGFDSLSPLFVLDDAGEAYSVPRAKQPYFCPQSFRAVKPQGTYRVFCLGGSTVQGRPFAVETSFTTFMRFHLETAVPAVDWEVINCGGISYASYRLVPILEEVLRYDPDLIVLCTGHNEFLEDREYARLRQRPAWLRDLQNRVARLHTFQLFRQAYLLARGATTEDKLQQQKLPAEVVTRLDYEGGLEKYHWDPTWRTGVIEHFEHNVRRMVDLCRASDVPVIVIDPGANLRDCPPFKAEYPPELDPRHQAEAARLWDRARVTYRDRPRQAIRHLEEAVKWAPQHAGLQFELAKLLDRVGEYEPALRHYRLARDFDVCPLRITSEMNAVLRRIAADEPIPLVTAREDFIGLSRDGIPGSFVYVDHVHPSIPMHEKLGEWLTRSVLELEGLQPAAVWPTEARQRIRIYLDNLDSQYFLRGQQRLENLRRWTQGRASSWPAAPQGPQLPPASDR